MLDNEEERARHLALGVEGPDADVAAALEGAAELAQGRGAPGDAVELLDLSCRLTPAAEVDALARRRVTLADVLVRAGDSQEAVRLLDDLFEGSVAGVARAQALELRARIHWVDGTSEEAFGAWVVCGDPAYAPQIRNVVSVWDDVYDAWVRGLDLQPELCRGGEFDPDYRPSFPAQVFPVFRAAALQRWTANLPELALRAAAERYREGA